MICPHCERVIRHGEMVRVAVLGEFQRVDVEGHSIRAYDEEWMEHISCVPVAWEEKAVKWVRRKWRWFKSILLGH